MNICYQCETDDHEKCIEPVEGPRCSCKIRQHTLKTYVIQATFEVQEFSPSNAKSILSDLLAYNSKLPAFTNMEIVFPVDPV